MPAAIRAVPASSNEAGSGAGVPTPMPKSVESSRLPKVVFGPVEFDTYAT